MCIPNVYATTGEDIFIPHGRIRAEFATGLTGKLRLNSHVRK